MKQSYAQALVAFFVLSAWVSGAPLLVINEVLSRPNRVGSDRFGFVDTSGDGDFVVSDWVEIYNPGDEPVDMTGMYLSDDCANPTRWQITAEAGFVVQPKKFVVIWCAGYFRGFKDCGTPESPRRCPREIPAHIAPFRIAAAGEWIGLYDSEGKLIDGFQVPYLPLDTTYGCYPDGDTEHRGILQSPTIGFKTDERASGEENTEIQNRGPYIKVRSYRGVIEEGDNIIYTTPTIDTDQKVRVLAEIRDLDDPDPYDNDNNIEEASVVLHWQPVGSGLERTVGMTPVSDDCTGPCTFGARIPGQPAGSIIEFWITAEDKQGNQGEARKVPGSTVNFMYPVSPGVGQYDGTMVINEVLASNAPCPDYEEGESEDPTRPICGTGAADERIEDFRVRKRADDWVELHNFGDEPLPFDHLYLTNNELNPLAFPLVSAQGLKFDSVQGGQLTPGGHLLIWCDREPQQNDDWSVHAPFALNAQEDTLFLIAYWDENSDGVPELFRIVDTVAWGPGEGRRQGPQFGPQDPDWSLGRYPDGPNAWGRMVPSPGTPATPSGDLLKYPGGPNTALVPFVQVVGFEPLIPQAGQPLTVYVRAWDEEPLAEGAVTFTYEGGDNGIDPRTVVLQRSPGPEGDIYRYSATITDPDLVGKIFYEVNVADSDGNVSRQPAGSETGKGILFFGSAAPGEDLIITEVVAANRQCDCGQENVPEGCERGGLDTFGDADDWVEVYNPNSSSLSLSDYYLTDKASWLTRWRFPRLNIGPGERVIVWCDGETEESGATPTLGTLHASFVLGAGSDEVYLVKGSTERKIVDAFSWRHLPSDVSFGREQSSGRIGVLLEATPGEENSPLAANARQISPSDPSQINPGTQLTVTGDALDQTRAVYVVDPLFVETVEMEPGVEVEVDYTWNWQGAVAAQWQLEGDALKVTLPSDLAWGAHLLAVLSGESSTWYEGGVPWTRILFHSTGSGAPVLFVRGDANDDGGIDIADAVAALQYLFSGRELPCVEAANVNDDQRVNIADAVYLLAYKFGGGPPPPPPFSGCGEDPAGSVLLPCSSEYCKQ